MRMLQIKFIFLFFILSQLFIQTVFAIENVEIEKTKLVTGISLDKVMEKAKEHAYDLKIADFNILISKQEVRGARSEYFPKLAANAGMEYTKNFRDTKDTQVMAIGDSFINPYTRYQSIIGITLSYNIFDFGVRRGNLNIAKEDILLKELEEKEKLQDLKLNLIDTYAKLLVTHKQIEFNKQILALKEKNLEYKQRLRKAGEISKTELNDAKVQVSNIKKRIYELNSIFGESASWLSFYTGDEYDIENLKVADIKKPNFDVNSFNDYTKSITWKIHEKQIKKKELEVKVAKRTNYPKVMGYTRYYMYGSDQTSYPDSFGDFGPSNFTVGGSIYMPLFDGFKNSANIQKAKLELSQLYVERDKAIAQLMTRLAAMRTNLIYLDEQIDENKKVASELTDKEKSVHRLVSKKLVSPIDENDAKIEVLENEIEYTKNTVTSIAITKGIQVLTEEQ